MFSFSDNHKSIKEINTMFSSGSLIISEKIGMGRERQDKTNRNYSA